MNVDSFASMAMATDQDDFHSPPEDGTNGTKRKADDGAQGPQRAKRNRYISIACNEVITFPLFARRPHRI